jgi:hypothetical protein
VLIFKTRMVRDAERARVRECVGAREREREGERERVREREGEEGVFEWNIPSKTRAVPQVVGKPVQSTRFMPLATR